MMKDNEIFDGVIGGSELSSKNIRKDISEIKNLKVKSELDMKMARLLTIHPELQVSFRNNDLASLDDKTKETLLKDMYDVLGITPVE